MASFLGARLARSGAAVTLAGSWSEGLLVLDQKGVRVEGTEGTFQASLAAVPLSGPLGEADEVLVITKSYRTREVAPRVALGLSPTGTVTTFQNGLGNVEILSALSGGAPIRQGVTTYGATLVGPGHVRVMEGALLLEEGALARSLREADLRVEITPKIEREVWRKLAVNCAVNPLSALAGLPNGALLEDPRLRLRLAAVAREVAAVAAARGTPLETDPVVLVEEVAEKTARNRSSMLQDLDRGFQTENEALSGALVREGERVGVPTPESAALYTAVREREASR
jgi:2-dehydropantoate 2-reductase